MNNYCVFVIKIRIEMDFWWRVLLNKYSLYSFCFCIFYGREGDKNNRLWKIVYYEVFLIIWG